MPVSLGMTNKLIDPRHSRVKGSGFVTDSIRHLSATWLAVSAMIVVDFRTEFKVKP